MFKFGTIGAFKQVRNNPRCKATAQILNGYVVLPDDSTGNAPTPADASTAQGDVWVANNVIDKPEIRNKEDFKIDSGEYVRSFLLSDLKELPVELDHRVLVDDISTLAVGDHLVPANATDHAGNEGKWVKPDGTTVVDSSAYAVHLEILEKTSFGDNGIYAVVKA